ncbi:hypothetical protein F7725_015131 [Dissostichus mawsoni]|uniref:Serine/threonine-protein phosphatase 2A activator n=1 Tax=Dissostichus mawsoni TaxID=36200 RepID=A0A7J5YGN4_DISMA|nr:hypothetical protein F7725_015131 [Dissostichus mawsoni]
MDLCQLSSLSQPSCFLELVHQLFGVLQLIHLHDGLQSGDVALAGLLQGGDRQSGKALLVGQVSAGDSSHRHRLHQAYADYIGFILALNGAVKGKKLSCEYKVSETVQKLLDLLGTLDRWINETPPLTSPHALETRPTEPGGRVLGVRSAPEDTSAAAAEIAVYLKESVGNAVRIDYGTGHEAAFAAFLCCLCKVGALKVDDQLAIVFLVFNRYLEVMRKLQKTYRMEPAGSQGVWGLDDFQFLPFIWGSSQFVDHPTLEPRHFLEERVVDEQQHEYMFLECIKFINEMKTGPFAEHSNQLWNISAVPSWSKVNQGLIRMYKAECLEKFPVIQHFKFGSLLSIQPGKP